MHSNNWGEYNYRQNQQFYLASNPNVKFIVISATTNKAFMLINSEHVSLDINSELIELNESQNINTSLDYLGKIIDINGGVIWPTNEKIDQIIQCWAIIIQYLA